MHPNLVLMFKVILSHSFESLKLVKLLQHPKNVQKYTILGLRIIDCHK